MSEPTTTRRVRFVNGGEQTDWGNGELLVSSPPLEYIPPAKEDEWDDSPSSSVSRKRKTAPETPPDSIVGRRSSRSQSAAAAKAEAMEAEEEEEEEAEDDEEEGEDGETEDEEDDMNDAASASSSEPGSRASRSSVTQDTSGTKKRGRPKGSKTRAGDEMEEEVTTPSTKNLTQRQRALLLAEQEGETAGGEELLSLPNRPLKSKNVQDLTEEQLAKKAAANERRKLNEKERMEKEKSDTIHKLLTNTPAKKGSSTPSLEKQSRHGKVQVKVHHARGRPPKKHAKDSHADASAAGDGEDADMAPGEDEDGLGEEGLGDVDNEELFNAAPVARVPKYSRNKVVCRQYLDVDPTLQAERDAKRVKSIPPSEIPSTAAPLIIPSLIDPTLPPLPAKWRIDVSFPESAPLPDRIFPFQTNVECMTDYLRRTKPSVGGSVPQVPPEQKNDGVGADGERTVTTSGGDDTTMTDIAPAASAHPSSSATTLPILHSDRTTPRVRSKCVRTGCGQTRRYTDTISQLPVCSLVCIKLIRPTKMFQDAVENAKRNRIHP